MTYQNAREILSAAADEQGWTLDSMLGVLANFVDDQSNEQLDLHAELRVFLEAQAKVENEADDDENPLVAKLISIANDAYPDGMVADAHEGDGLSDGLAKFIANEIVSVIGNRHGRHGDENESFVLSAVREAMTTAREELEAVENAFKIAEDDEQEVEIAVSVRMGMAINLAMGKAEFEAMSPEERAELVSRHAADWLHSVSDDDVVMGVKEALDGAEVIDERDRSGNLLS
jgi:hypothetical protein